MKIFYDNVGNRTVRNINEDVERCSKGEGRRLTVVEGIDRNKNNKCLDNKISGAIEHIEVFVIYIHALVQYEATFYLLFVMVYLHSYLDIDYYTMFILFIYL